MISVSLLHVTLILHIQMELHFALSPMQPYKDDVLVVSKINGFDKMCTLMFRDFTTLIKSG